jgi:hypothetical protein
MSYPSTNNNHCLILFNLQNNFKYQHISFNEFLSNMLPITAKNLKNN